MPEINQQWEDDWAAFEPVAEKMLLAGWVTGYAKGDNGVAIDWTPLGIERLKSLFELRKDLSDGSFHPERFKTLISLMRQESVEQGWSETP
jgi:hypothetical protein